MNDKQRLIVFGCGVLAGLTLAALLGEGFNRYQAKQRAEWEKLHPKVREDIDSAFGVN